MHPKMDERYDPAAVEAKWQRLWRERRTNTIDLRAAQRPYYNLMMFPYPSAEGLHVGQRLRLHRAPTSTAASSGCRGSTSSSPWASTPSASTPRTTRSRWARIRRS